MFPVGVAWVKTRIKTLFVCGLLIIGTMRWWTHPLLDQVLSLPWKSPVDKVAIDLPWILLQEQFLFFILGFSSFSFGCLVIP